MPLASTGPIAFICAMPAEAQPLARALDLRRSPVAGLRGYNGWLGERPVLAVVCGMGTELATDATRRLLQSQRVARVVVVGITGAVHDETPIGTLVLPEIVIDSATGERFTPHPLGDGEGHGAMWTTDVLLTDPAEVERVRSLGVVSLDMETAAIARECVARDVPWSVFRVISDRATDGSVDAEVFGLSRQDGSPDLRAVARYLITRPHRIPGLVRLAKGSRLAAERAAAEAIRACSALEDR